MRNIRRFFAGSNSSQGFYSFFENIISPQARRVYFLKGGPGTGKSSFMKQIADAAEAQIYERELFYCSSDSNALDAVAFPELGIAVLDATLPHALEPSWPGCRDRIISLQDFWSATRLEKQLAEIVKIGRLKQANFAASFRYFRAALAVEENMAARNYNRRWICKKSSDTILDFLYASKPKGSSGARHLFASALTPEGYISHIVELVADYQKVFMLDGDFGLGQEEYLQKIVSFAMTMGHDLEIFYYPLDPSRILHVLIPGLQLAILSALPDEDLTGIEGQRIACGCAQVQANEADRHLRQELLDLGFAALLEAQKTHSQVEQIYAEAMDFNKLSLYRAQIQQEIFYENLS